MYRKENETSINPVVNSTTSDGVLNKEELNILYYVVRYGEVVLFALDDGEYQTVSQFVLASLSELAVDGENMFYNPLHQKMLDEVKDFKFGDMGSMSKFFTNHIDPNISAITAELMTDKYTLSRIHAKSEEYAGDQTNEKAKREHQMKMELQRKENLAREVNLVIHEYKAAIICMKDREIDQKIREAQELKNIDEIMDLMRMKKVLLETKAALAKEIGVRVILGR